MQCCPELPEQWRGSGPAVPMIPNMRGTASPSPLGRSAFSQVSPGVPPSPDAVSGDDWLTVAGGGA